MWIVSSHWLESCPSPSRGYPESQVVRIGDLRRTHVESLQLEATILPIDAIVILTICASWLDAAGYVGKTAT